MKKRVTEKVADALNGSPEGNRPREFLIEPTFDEDGVQVSSGIDLLGREHPDPQPVEVPLGRGSLGLDALIKSYVRRELSQLAGENQFETFEEADDFDLESDDFFDRETEYERDFDPPVQGASPIAAAGSPAAPGGVSAAPPPFSSSGSDPGGGGGPSQTEAPPAAEK